MRNAAALKRAAAKGNASRRMAGGSSPKRPGRPDDLSVSDSVSRLKQQGGGGSPKDRMR